MSSFFCFVSSFSLDLKGMEKEEEISLIKFKRVLTILYFVSFDWEDLSWEEERWLSEMLCQRSRSLIIASLHDWGVKGEVEGEEEA